MARAYTRYNIMICIATEASVYFTDYPINKERSRLSFIWVQKQMDLTILHSPIVCVFQHLVSMVVKDKFYVSKESEKSSSQGSLLCIKRYGSTS